MLVTEVLVMKYSLHSQRIHTQANIIQIRSFWAIVCLENWISLVCKVLRIALSMSLLNRHLVPTPPNDKQPCQDLCRPLQTHTLPEVSSPAADGTFGLSSGANKKWDEFHCCLTRTWHWSNHLTTLSVLLQGLILGREKVEVCSMDSLTFADV